MSVQTYLGNIMKYCKLCSCITVCSTHFNSQTFHVLNHYVPLPPFPPPKGKADTVIWPNGETSSSVHTSVSNMSKPGNNITLSVQFLMPSIVVLLLEYEKNYLEHEILYF
jgi:hypothetical protein